MHLLRTLGSASLFHRTDSGDRCLEIQPKRLALLVFLARGGPGPWVRRDTLLSLFWPDADDTHGRGALRQSLTALRRLLGSDVLLTQGEDEVGLTPAAVSCDATDFEQSCAAGRHATAGAMYAGHFLAGFHVDSVAPEFGQWLDGERTRLRLLACAAAWQAAAESERGGLGTEASSWARRAVALAPDDEVGVGRLIVLLDRQGNRAGALSAFDLLQRQLATDYGSEPSPETQALISAVRSRRAAKTTVHGPGEARIGSVPRDGPAPATVSAASLAPSTRGDPRPPARFRWALAPVAMAVLAGTFAIAARRHSGAAATTIARRDDMNAVAAAGLTDLGDEAHRLYLRAVYLEGRRSAQAFGQARLLLMQAIERDPVYADAWVELASSYIGLAHYEAMNPRDAFTRAAAAARQALEIDPALSRAHAMLAASQPYLDWDWDAAARKFEDALRFDPGDANAHNLFGIQLRFLGRYAEAEREMATAARLDPLSRHYLRQLAYVFVCAGRFEDAAVQARKANAMDPQYQAATPLLVSAMVRQGRYDEALDGWRDLARATGDSAALRRLALEHGRAGYQAEEHADAESTLAALTRQATNGYAGPAAFSAVHARLGHWTAALAWLRRAYEAHDPGVMKVGCDIAYAPLRSNAAFLEVMRRVGMSPQALSPLMQVPPTPR